MSEINYYDDTLNSKFSNTFRTTNLPKSVIERVPFYINYLDKLISENVLSTSSKIISTELGLGEVQVRKDLNLISGKGKPKIGYNVKELREDFRKLVNIETTNMIIVGAGKIGEGLAMYKGFNDCGFSLVGVFDNDINKIGKKVCDLKIESNDKIQQCCYDKKVLIGIITVPKDKAQEVCNMMISYGIKGILNFTSVKLDVPDNISVRNVDISSLLTMLAIEIKNS